MAMSRCAATACCICAITAGQGNASVIKPAKRHHNQALKDSSNTYTLQVTSPRQLKMCQATPPWPSLRTSITCYTCTKATAVPELLLLLQDALKEYPSWSDTATGTGLCWGGFQSRPCSYRSVLNRHKPQHPSRAYASLLILTAGYQAKSVEDVPGNPTLAVTADFNYVLRFYKGNGRVWVKDVQGNDVTIKSKPIQFGQISVVSIDTVLMSGGYFFTGLVRS
jgi:hypothetical protein